MGTYNPNTTRISRRMKTTNGRESDRCRQNRAAPAESVRTVFGLLGGTANIVIAIFLSGLPFLESKTLTEIQFALWAEQLKAAA